MKQWKWFECCCKLPILVTVDLKLLCWYFLFPGTTEIAFEFENVDLRTEQDGKITIFDGRVFAWTLICSILKIEIYRWERDVKALNSAEKKKHGKGLLFLQVKQENYKRVPFHSLPWTKNHLIYIYIYIFEKSKTESFRDWFVLYVQTRL